MIDVFVQASLVPIIIALIQALKIAGLPARFAPIVAVVLGVISCIYLLPLALPVEILQGVVVGLAASGLYSGAKAQFKNESV